VIQDLIEERGIRRLVHLTRIDNIVSIASSDGLLSRFTARNRGIKLPINSQNVPTRLQNYISASIEYPNNYLLSQFAARHPRADWVALILDARVMATSGVKFSATNAASGGASPASGLAGLLDLYAGWIPASRKRRSPNHLPAAPTDIQAEVLIPSMVEFSHVTAIVTKDKLDQDEVALYLERANVADTPAIWVYPDLFSTGYVHKKVHR